MSQHSGIPREPGTHGAPTLSPEKPHVSPEFEVLSQDIVTEVTDYLAASDDALPRQPHPLMQQNAFAANKEDERDYFIDALGETLGRNIDDEMTASETDWLAAGNSRVTIEPWMKGPFRLPNPDEPIRVRGTRREVKLSADAQPELWLNEIEVPVSVNIDGVQEHRAVRAIYFTAFSMREAERDTNTLGSLAPLALHMNTFFETDAADTTRSSDEAVPPAVISLDAGSENQRKDRNMVLAAMGEALGIDRLTGDAYDQGLLEFTLNNSTVVSDGPVDLPMWFREQAQSVLGAPDPNQPFRAQVITREALMKVEAGRAYYLRELELPVRDDNDFASLPPRRIRATYYESEPALQP